jgi:hypothetical protein
MHALDTLYQEHLARRQIPSRDLLEQHTRRITNESLAVIRSAVPTCRDIGTKFRVGFAQLTLRNCHSQNTIVQPDKGLTEPIRRRTTV